MDINQLNRALSNGILPSFLNYNQDSYNTVLDLEKVKYNSFIKRYDIDINSISYIPNVDNIFPLQTENTALDFINEKMYELNEYNQIKDYYKNYVLSQLKTK